MHHFLLTLVLLGALQGFICSGLLLLRQSSKLPERLLAILIFVIALANLNIFLWYQQLSSIWSTLGNILPLLLFMAIGPLLFLYVRASLQTGYKLTNKDWLHFAPVSLDVIPYVVAGFYYAGVFDKDVFIFVDTYHTYVDIPRWLSLTTYCLLSWKLIDNKKASTNSNLPIIKQILIPVFIFQIIWFIFLLVYIIPGYRETLIRSVGWFPLYIPLSALIYWTGFISFKLIIPPFEKPKSLSSSNNLPDEKVNEVVQQLKQAMENDQLYLDPDLNLNRLVDYCTVPQKIISTVLNQHMNTSFNEFVNLYRVEAFKRKIKDPNMQRYTIKGIALDCGFNSLATFQRVFKQMTGQLPSAFRDTGSNNNRRE